MAFDQRQTKTLVYMAAAESYEMSDITPLDDFDKHITNAFKAKTVKLSVDFGALSVLNRVLCYVGKQLLKRAVHFHILHGKKKKRQCGWHIFGTRHLFCLWTMHFKEGQDAHLAKCVPNKWYPKQNGSSFEDVQDKGIGLHPAASAQEQLVRGPTASVDLAAQKVSDREPGGTSGKYGSTFWSPKWVKMQTKQSKNYNDAFGKQTGKGERWHWKDEEVSKNLFS